MATPLERDVQELEDGTASGPVDTRRGTAPWPVSGFAPEEVAALMCHVRAHGRWSPPSGSGRRRATLRDRRWRHRHPWSATSRRAMSWRCVQHDATWHGGAGDRILRLNSCAVTPPALLREHLRGRGARRRQPRGGGARATLAVSSAPHHPIATIDALVSVPRAAARPTRLRPGGDRCAARLEATAWSEVGLA